MPTINKPFGIADPHYDALRVQSNQAIMAGAGDGVVPGSGLENKIYLWHSDGSTIATYDPDQAGLIAALAAAFNGDTIWMPSISIALATGITVPADVTLAGISENAVMSFSGASGTLITLADGVRLFNFNIRATSDGIGITVIDARYNNVVVAITSLIVYAGVANDIGILSGV